MYMYVCIYMYMCIYIYIYIYMYIHVYEGFRVTRWHPPPMYFAISIAQSMVSPRPPVLPFDIQSVNQSKILTEPHTGREKPIPALPQGAATPASRSDTGLIFVKWQSHVTAKAHLRHNVDAPPVVFCNPCCAVYGFPPPPLSCHSTYNIREMAISCKGLTRRI